MGRYWLQTLGCPKNQVDSDKLEGHLAARGYRPAAGPETADLVVVNTCAFIEAARQESIDTVLELADGRAEGSRLVVTGCMAERYGDELRQALPEVDLVAGFGQDLIAPPRRRPGRPRGHQGHGARAACGWLRPARVAPSRHPRPVGLRQGGGGLRPHLRLLRHSLVPGQAAVPPRRRDPGRGRRAGAPARTPVPRPCARSSWWLRTSPPTPATAPDPGGRAAPRTDPHLIAALTREVAARVARTRLLYLYPSGLTNELVEAVLSTGVPYFDLSLQHVSRPTPGRHAPLGRRRTVPAPHRRHPSGRPRRHLPFLVHPRLSR